MEAETAQRNYGPLDDLEEEEAEGAEERVMESVRQSAARGARLADFDNDSTPEPESYDPFHHQKHLPGRKMLLLVGNPGRGKSTLANALMQEKRFLSGTSAGTGLTTHMQKHEKNGVVYVDTPGLADTEKRKEAAEEISKSLKLDGLYKLVFVVTLVSGRVLPEDNATIKVVLDALADVPNLTYGICINKITAGLRKKIINGGMSGNGYLTAAQWQQHIFMGLNSEHRVSDYICLYKKDSDLSDHDNILVSPQKTFVHWLQNLPAVEIKPPQVKELKPDALEGLREQFAAEMKEMEKKEKKRRKKLKKQIEFLKSLPPPPQPTVIPSGGGGGCTIL